MEYRGWAVLPVRSVSRGVLTRSYEAFLLSIGAIGQCRRLATGERLVARQGFEDVGLSEREHYLWVVLGVHHDQVLNLWERKRVVSVVSERYMLCKMINDTYLVAPEHGIALLALGLVPYLEQLLRGQYPWSTESQCLLALGRLSP